MTSWPFVHLADEALAAAKRLNEAIREDPGGLSVADARQVAKRCREAEGWLLGCRILLEVEA